MLSKDFHKNGPIFFIIRNLSESLLIFKAFDADFFV